MCEFDFVIGKHHVEQPFTAHKVFRKLTRKWAYFWSVLGRIPRGVWIRFDGKEIDGPRISLCHTYENGFHCFVCPKEMIEKEAGIAAGEEVSTIPVQVKGDITVANQFDEEILVGEWIYVPTIEELEREEALAA